ncbi:TIGR04283 family arsenosugar biosynthesis glycosyltransferase [Anthocerotibacter panamensis]|uniref:TIGR04283 family arsenosugar biosynthesis glycosyltransferase n=1 Tax=Anthocerotibacter panamensis TaxID=2857077 RepID=UPI001C40222A|nr:TIGR04283 family arsenosugar biosynthesis glycosyltransferase [Anthocerotibacter panamensis]
MTGIAIVIPTYQECRSIVPCLRALAEQEGAFEVFIADGGSTDGTLEQVVGVRVSYPLAWGVAPERGRSAQMNWGAQQTTADILLFLHADTRLAPGALALLQTTLQQDGWVGGRFDVRLDSEQWPYLFIAWAINQRSRLARRFTGDMGIFVRRTLFEKLGGFPPQPLMEDLEFSAQLYRMGAVACLALPVTTSARRWHKGGLLRTFLLMQVLRTAYALGVDPETLHRWYHDIR